MVGAAKPLITAAHARAGPFCSRASSLPAGGQRFVNGASWPAVSARRRHCDGLPDADRRGPRMETQPTRSRPRIVGVYRFWRDLRVRDRPLWQPAASPTSCRPTLPSGPQSRRSRARRADSSSQGHSLGATTPRDLAAAGHSVPTKCSPPRTQDRRPPPQGRPERQLPNRNGGRLWTMPRHRGRNCWLRLAARARPSRALQQAPAAAQARGAPSSWTIRWATIKYRTHCRIPGAIPHPTPMLARMARRPKLLRLPMRVSPILTPSSWIVCQEGYQSSLGRPAKPPRGSGFQQRNRTSKAGFEGVAGAQGPSQSKNAGISFDLMRPRRGGDKRDQRPSTDSVVLERCPRFRLIAKNA